MVSLLVVVFEMIVLENVLTPRQSLYKSFWDFHLPLSQEFFFVGGSFFNFLYFAPPTKMFVFMGQILMELSGAETSKP